MFVGNSIENMTVAAVQFTRESGSTATFSNVTFSGNQIAICPYCLVVDPSGFLSNFTISGNSFNLAANGYSCINLASGSIFNISGNTFHGNGGNTTGIGVALGCSNGIISDNTFNNFTASISNNSASTVVKKHTVTGKATITTDTQVVGDGANFYTGWTYVNYGVTFSGDVSFVCSICDNPTGSALSAQGNDDNKSRGYVVGVSVTNGIPMTIAWQATGVLA